MVEIIAVVVSVGFGVSVIMEVSDSTLAVFSAAALCTTALLCSVDECENPEFGAMVMGSVYDVSGIQLFCKIKRCVSKIHFFSC